MQTCLILVQNHLIPGDKTWGKKSTAKALSSSANGMKSTAMVTNSLWKKKTASFERSTAAAVVGKGHCVS